MANTVICPHCGARLEVADGEVERTMIESSGKPREWVLRVDRLEIHRCTVDAERALAT
jgi:hypothetical protein